MFKLKFTIIAICGLIANQAIAKDTTKFIRGECNNMGVMESECDSFSSVRAVPLINAKPKTVSAELPYNQVVNDPSNTLNNHMASPSGTKMK